MDPRLGQHAPLHHSRHARVLEQSLRAFAARHASLFLARDEEMFSTAAPPVRLTPDLWQIVFSRKVAGVPVSVRPLRPHDRTRKPDRLRRTTLGSREGGRGTVDRRSVRSGGPVVLHGASFSGLRRNRLLPSPDRAWSSSAPCGRLGKRRYGGPIGEGYDYALAWRIALRVPGEPGRLGGAGRCPRRAILAFFDEDRARPREGRRLSGIERPVLPGDASGPAIRSRGGHRHRGAPRPPTDGLFECSPAFSEAARRLPGVRPDHDSAARSRERVPRLRPRPLREPEPTAPCPRHQRRKHPRRPVGLLPPEPIAGRAAYLRSIHG